MKLEKCHLSMITGGSAKPPSEPEKQPSKSEVKTRTTGTGTKPPPSAMLP